jgi:hypothetical protein
MAKKRKFFVFVILILGLLVIVGISLNRTVYKKWKFSDKQYEFSINNLNYFINNSRTYGVEGKIPVLFATASARLKNVSIEPFIVKGEIARCKIYKGDQLTNFYVLADLPVKKGLLLGEELSFVATIEISGQDYNSSGNKTYPSMGLKIKSCEIILATSNSNITYLNALASNPIDADIEPKVILFK